MRDKAYKRDLRRAIELIVPVKVIETKNGSHLRIVVTMPDGQDKEFTASGSPRDHEHSIRAVVSTIKKHIKGTYS